MVWMANAAGARPTAWVSQVVLHWFEVSAPVWLSVAILAAEPARTDPPRIANLSPASAPPRTLIVVRGDGVESALVWDAGSPSEKILPSALGGATMFSVPADAAPGDHAVAIQGAQRSATASFRVAGDPPMAKPRIDSITLVDTKFQAGNMVQAILYVQGANIDVGAKVLVDGVETASDAHKALINNMFGANPAVLAYPIRHYLSRTVALSPRAPRSTVNVQVRNEGNELSEVVDYALPASPETLDSDGDGIPDVVELNGYDNGKGRIDLRALGADPFRKDVFVEVDIMAGVPYAPIPTNAGRAGTFDLLRSMFAKAPILNPFGDNEIHLCIDASGMVPAWDFVAFQAQNDLSLKIASFDLLKQSYFTPARHGLFHYAIWAKAHIDNWSGESNLDIDGTKVGDGFMIAMADFPQEFQTLKTQAGTFAHELGHDLGQRHGGADDAPFKPTYWSVMSYSWQTRSSWPDASRLAYPTCTPIYYGADGAAEPNGALPNPIGKSIDYSEGMGPTLFPNNFSLSEQLGVCGQPIDWDHDGVISDRGVKAVLNMADPTAPVGDFPNWSSLRFNGPSLGGRKFQQ